MKWLLKNFAESNYDTIQQHIFLRKKLTFIRFMKGNGGAILVWQKKPKQKTKKL